MDIPRPELKRKKRMRQAGFAAVGVLVLGAATLGLMRLEPAAPSVTRASVWIDSVRQGEMLREVRGPGTLVPRVIRWIGAQTEGRVERVVVRPGATVTADTVLVEMTNPELLQETEEARYAVVQADGRARRAQAHAREQAARSEGGGRGRSGRVRGRAPPGRGREGGGQTSCRLIKYQRSELLAAQMKVKRDIEQERLDQFAASVEAQLAVRKAKVEQARNAYERKQRARRRSVGARRHGRRRAGGAWSRKASASCSARTSRASRGPTICAPSSACRKPRRATCSSISSCASIRATASSRAAWCGSIPAVQSGTVQVDVDFTGALPRGARPDLSVDGTIEIERLPQRASTPAARLTASRTRRWLFKLVEDGRYAVHVPVELGRTSVNAVEIVKGLAGRSSDPVRHVRVGRPRSDPSELTRGKRDERFDRAKIASDPARGPEEGVLHRRGRDARALRRALRDSEGRLPVDFRAVGLRQVDACCRSSACSTRRRRGATC